MDDRKIIAYADKVWNDSLSGDTKLIDDSLRVTPGKYDDIDLFASLVANKRKIENTPKSVERINGIDINYGRDEKTQHLEEEEEQQEYVNKRVLVQRKKKKENHKKFISRLAVAILVCATMYAGVNYLSSANVDRPEVVTINGKDFNVGDYANKKIEELSKKYNSMVSNNWLYIKDTSVKKGVYKYNYRYITSILKSAAAESDIELNIAVVQIANRLTTNDAYQVLKKCLEDIGYSFIDIDANKKVVGGGSKDYQDYLDRSERIIYAGMVSNTISKINNGTVLADSDGNLYEVGYDFAKENNFSAFESHGRGM